jgi:putative RNA 2'-phosphotransferase
MSERITKTSKFLSFVLRHRPERIGLALDDQGWAFIDDLIACAAANGRALDRALIEEVVATNDKQRFALSDDGLRIRASQGHSIDVELGLEPRLPPASLFHGTADRFLGSIRRHGLIRGRRHHVHLSADRDTALRVGSRHGQPVILIVDAAGMHAAGHAFFLSANGVWLTESVPPAFLE